MDILKNIKRPLHPFFLLLFLGLCCFVHGEEYDPVSLYLSLEKNPSTEMTVRWISDNGKTDDVAYYRQRGYPDWIPATGQHIDMPDNHPYLIHRIDLTGLQPDSEYFLKIGEEGKQYKFKTLPQFLYEPIDFVVGGDMYHDDIETYAQTNRAAAATGPKFAMLGGDIAYAAPKGWFSSNREDFPRWLDWLRVWKETMITPEGYSIPMIIAIGNHEVLGRYVDPGHAKFFYALFRYPDTKSYQTVDFGKYLSIVVLDSGHTQPINGIQQEWLEEALAQREAIPHKFAIYHVPAYPSVRKFKGKTSAMIRDHWVPLFENYGINAAFEHHDHTYKRTHPITKDKIDQEHGVLYLGDGAWGIAKPRHPATPAERWYLAATFSQRHFIRVIIDGANRYFMAITPQGKIFDFTFQSQCNDYSECVSSSRK